MEMTLLIDPAEPSTPEYYSSNKNTFPINMDNNIRGRAIVFVMTEGRTQGWQKEVWAKYKMFKAIGVQTEFVYDPTASTIKSTLATFTTNERTKNADMVFITFCGHGCNKDVKEKPKIVLVQSCRNIAQCSGNSNTNSETQQDTKYMRKPESLQEYMFSCASQPEDEAYRSHFSESVSEFLIQNSGKYKLQDIFTAQLTELLKSIQSEQCCIAIILDLNMFLGYTRESDLQYSVQESSTLSSSVLEPKVNISKVDEGSVITQEYTETLNTLLFMNDTGLLSYEMQFYLITEEYLNHCKVERVEIKATVKSQIMPAFLEGLLLGCIVENKDVSVKCPFEALNEGTWFKDGHPLEMTERHNCLEDDKPKKNIVKTTKEDRERYKCKYTGLDDRNK